MKGVQFSNITNFVPINFKLEHNSLAQNGLRQVTYQTEINGVPIEKVTYIKHLKENLAKQV